MRGGAVYLHHDAFEPRQREVGLLVVLAQEAAKLVEVVAQQLGHDEQVLLAVEVVDQPQHVVLRV